MIDKKILLLLITCLMFVSSASAIVNISVGSVSTTSIQWTWAAGLNVTSLSVDGYLVYPFDHTSNTFILSQLNPNETHVIMINTPTDNGTNITSTLPTTTNQEQFYGLLNTWGYLLLIAAFMAIGMMRRLGIFLLIASVISLYALFLFITMNVPGSNPLIELPFFIYLFFFIFPHYLAFRKGGYTK